MLMSNLETLLDGLPYVEEVYGSGAAKAQAESLINEELSRSGPFLESHPNLAPAVSLNLSPLAQAEFERIERGEPNSARPKSKVEFPDDNDPDAALASVNQSSIVAEMLEFQALNANLTGKYSDKAYEQYTTMMANELAELQSHLHGALTEQNIVNAKRKKIQVDAAGVLQGLEAKFRERTLRCQQLHLAISQQQQQLKSAQT